MTKERGTLAIIHLVSETSGKPYCRVEEDEKVLAWFYDEILAERYVAFLSGKTAIPYELNAFLDDLEPATFTKTKEESVGFKLAVIVVKVFLQIQKDKASA